MTRLLGLIILIILSSCTNDDVGIERSFYMGSTINVSSTSSSDSLLFPGFSDGEIVHFSFKETGQLFQDSSANVVPEHVLENWNSTKTNASIDQKIYVSVSPLSSKQDGLANYITARGDEKLKNALSGSSPFFDMKVRLAYVDYCKQLIDFFNPAYFNMGEDVNKLFLVNREEWTDFLSFHEFVYTQLKLSYPNLVIFSSVASELMIEGLLPNQDALLHQIAVLQILENSDLFTLSIHPNSFYVLANEQVKNSFSKLFSINKKPFALCITKSFSNLPLMFKNLEENSSHASANVKLDLLLEACLKRKSIFIVRSEPQDFDIATMSSSKKISRSHSEKSSNAWNKYRSVELHN